MQARLRFRISGNRIPRRNLVTAMVVFAGVTVVGISGCSGPEFCRRSCSVIRPLNLTRHACLDRPCTCEPSFPRQAPIESAGIEIGQSTTVPTPVYSPDTEAYGSMLDEQSSHRNNWQSITNQGSDPIVQASPRAFDSEKRNGFGTLHNESNVDLQANPKLEPSLVELAEPAVSQDSFQDRSEMALTESPQLTVDKQPFTVGGTNSSRRSDRPVFQEPEIETRESVATKSPTVSIESKDPTAEAVELNLPTPKRIEFVGDSSTRHNDEASGTIAPSETRPNAQRPETDTQVATSETFSLKSDPITLEEIEHHALQNDELILKYRERLAGIETKLVGQVSSHPAVLESLLREIMQFDEDSHLNLQQNFAKLRRFDRDAKETALKGLLQREELRLVEAERLQQARYLWFELYVVGQRFESSCYLADVMEDVLLGSTQATALNPAMRSLAKSEIAQLREQANESNRRMSEIYVTLERLTGIDVDSRVEIPFTLPIERPSWIVDDLETSLRSDQALVGRLRIINEARTMGISVLEHEAGLNWAWTLQPTLQIVEGKADPFLRQPSKESSVKLPLTRKQTQSGLPSRSIVEEISETRSYLLDQLLETTQQANDAYQAIENLKRQFLPESTEEVTAAIDAYRQGDVDVVDFVSALKMLHHLEHAYHQSIADLNCRKADAERIVGHSARLN